MILSNIEDALEHNQPDKKTGVKLALLAGDEETSVFAIELQEGQSIPAHYHTAGIETYFILQGEGVVSTGEMQGNRVNWKSKERVKSGDSFTIHPHEVHKFQNISHQPLRILATAPLSHSGHDRIFVEDTQLIN